jgi:hypothetical protein
MDLLNAIGSIASVIGLLATLYTLYRVANLPTELKRQSRDKHLSEKTDSEVIDWKVVSSDQHSGILLNAFQVVRTFAADYPIGKRKYELLFVERKADFQDEFGDSTEGYGFELLIMDEDQQIVLSLDEGVVDRDDQLKLSGLIVVAPACDERRNARSRSDLKVSLSKLIEMLPLAEDDDAVAGRQGLVAGGREYDPPVRPLDGDHDDTGSPFDIGVAQAVAGHRAR